VKVAILDDYQNVALRLADWSAVRRHAEITVFNDHIADPSAVVERLRPFDAICVMRERTPLTREILQQLPNRRRDREVSCRGLGSGEPPSRRPLRSLDQR
jgi:hypothetical protein